MTAEINGIIMIAKIIPADKIPMPTGGPETNAPRNGTPAKAACKGICTYSASTGPNTNKPHIP
jgi:hypothetical protein